MTSPDVKGQPLLTLSLSNDGDVVLARRRARQVALLLGFDLHDQTRVSTAVSEIARNAVLHAGGGKLAFILEDVKQPYSLVSQITDSGPGIAEPDEMLSGGYGHNGLHGASKLVDKISIETSSSGTVVRLRKHLAERLPFTSKEMNEIANSLTKTAAISLIDEVHQQNQELITALEQLSQKQALLDEANAELALSNKNLNQANDDMHVLNDSLELKVQDRTSELMAANDELQAARDEAVRANELKTQFVANMSHEIRTPMAGILGLAEVLATDEELDETSREMAQCIVQAGKDLMHIVNDILDFSKLEAGRVDLLDIDFNVEPLVKDVFNNISTQAAGKDLKLELLVDDTVLKTMRGDSPRIKQALLNLAQNAIKFTSAGQISIMAQLQSITDDGLHFVRFSVRDTGIGIPQESQGKLFQPFIQVDGSTTRKYGGTGLGLSIVRKSVELMFGTVGLSSIEGQGSEFWFTVPLKLADAVHAF